MAIANMHNDNELECLIDQAAKDPVHSPACYAGLMGTSVFVPIEQNEVDSELLCWDEGGLAVLPCFTSLDLLREFLNEMIDKKSIETKSNYSYLHMPITELFHSELKAAIHVNPMAESECVLMPHDIEYLSCSNEKVNAMTDANPLARRDDQGPPSLSVVQ